MNAPVSWRRGVGVVADAGPSAVKKTLNMLPPTARRGVRRPGSAPRPAAPASVSPTRRRGGRRPRRWPGAAWSARRWWRPGSPTACRPGRRAPRARAAPITSARPPNAAAGKPPPITLPKVNRSGAQPSTRAVEPPLAAAARPGSRSSPRRRRTARRDAGRARRGSALKPGSGGTTPMLPGDGLGDQAGDLGRPARRRRPRRRRGRCRAARASPRSTAAGTPGRAGHGRRVASPEPAAASSESTWPW